MPGFGEVHKHIESTHLTPEFEAALVLPRGNTWTCEASHEFANVNGLKNTEFWQKARQAGSPLKIFIQPGSAVPPSAWEESGGWYGLDEQAGFLRDELSVTSLDEVMDWPSVWDPREPRLRAHVGHDRRHLARSGAWWKDTARGSRTCTISRRSLRPGFRPTTRCGRSTRPGTG